MKAADAVWVAAAMLQRERGPEADMSVAEIVDKAAELNGFARATLQTMASQHLVATARPSPDRYRMLTAVGRGRRRLYRPGDPADPRRTGPVHPVAEELPDEFRPLIKWYLNECSESSDRMEALEKLMRWTRASGLWKGLDPDEHVRDLRAGWE
jgi:hypothetical protein